MRALWSAACVALLVACGGTSGAETDQASAAAERVVNVEVIEVTTEPFEDAVGITGAVEAERDVMVSAEEAGVVRAIHVAKGARVRAGQPLLTIDDRVLRAQHDQAVAEAALARETFERQRRLWEDEKIGSEMNYLRARYGAETAEANARVLAARLDRTVVRAPLGGVLDARNVEVGSMVSPGAPVARIIDTDTLKVSGGVPERYAGEIRPGSRASVWFDTFGDREFTGTTRFVGSSISQMNRTFPVEVNIPNPGGVLKPGMVAQIRLARGETRDAILVPREAVLRTENGYIVYRIVEEAGKMRAEATTVATGSGAGNRVVIESGLQPGDRVVVVGQHQVANGDVVALVERQGGT